VLGDTLYVRLLIVRPSNQCVARTIAINTPKQRHPQQEAVEGSASGCTNSVIPRQPGLPDAFQFTRIRV